jgi:hypothetical protein
MVRLSELIVRKRRGAVEQVFGFPTRLVCLSDMCYSLYIRHALRIGGAEELVESAQARWYLIRAGGAGI